MFLKNGFLLHNTPVSHYKPSKSDHSEGGTAWQYGWPLCAFFLSPSWTTAWRDPYLVIVGGGNGKALKARLCGDAIRQTAVGMRSPRTPEPSCPIPFIALLLFNDHNKMLMKRSEACWLLSEQEKLLERPWDLGWHYHAEPSLFRNHK